LIIEDGFQSDHQGNSLSRGGLKSALQENLYLEAIMPKSETGPQGAIPTPPKQEHVKVTNAEKFGAVQKGNFSKMPGAGSKPKVKGK